MPHRPAPEMRYAIVQGIDVSAEKVIHVFALDSQKHTATEFFLRAADWLPSESDTRELGGTRTPVVYAIVGSVDEVKAFDRRLRQAIQRLSSLAAAGTLLQFENELARYEATAGEASQMTDGLMLSLMIRATFPSPAEMRYPTLTVMQQGGSMAFGFWTVTTPHEERQKRPQVERLLETWLNMM
jgi:hypothetical protein